MKIAFFCGSLESGKDGVGDYSRLLAAECERLGHTTFLAGLNDHWLKEPVNVQTEREIRLHVSQSWPQRLQIVADRLRHWKPDILSLQFVPYAFHPRGLAGTLGKLLTKYFPEHCWHIMFHELWLGGGKNDKLPRRLLGVFQKRSVLALLDSLQPVVMHTHAFPYRQMLARSGVAVKSLPLFANIDVISRPNFEWISNKLSSELPDTGAERRLVVLFGSIHPEWDPALLLRKIATPGLTLLSIGRPGKIGLEHWLDFAVQYAGQAKFIHWGELTPAQISDVLQFADAGVATSPWALLEKSGTAAAMIEHGLPVLVTRNDFASASLAEINPAWAARCFPVWDDHFSWERLEKQPPVSSLPSAAQIFVQDLESARS